MQITTTGPVVLTPPTQGIHQGVVAFQDRASSAPNTITGTPPGKTPHNIQGTIYTPSAKLNIQANNTDVDSNGIPKDKIGSQIITGSFSVTGGGGFSVAGGTGTPIRLIQLIE
jgi:hypothetical protein